LYTRALDQLFVPGQQLHAYEHTIQQYHVRSYDRASPPQNTNIADVHILYASYATYAKTEYVRIIIIIIIIIT